MTEGRRQEDRTRRRITRHRRGITTDHLFLMFVVLVPFVALLGIMVYPLGSSLVASFYSHRIFFPVEPYFIGLTNYLEALQDSRFYDSLRVTSIFTAGTTLLTVGGGLLVAALLNVEVLGHRIFGRDVLRSLILIPFVLSPAVIGAVGLAYLWNPRSGVATLIVERLGFVAPPWLSQPDSAMFAVVVSESWIMFPLVVILLDAAMRAIPRSLYEAAELDGASRWWSFTSVTLPLIVPQLLIVLVLRITSAWRSFDLIYMMTEGGPGRSTQTLSISIYTNLMRYGEFGYANALSWIMVASLAIICGALIWIVGKRSIVLVGDK